MCKRAIFFDRDGTLNNLITRKEGHQTSPFNYSELVFTITAKEAVHMAKDHGFMTFVVTNQPHHKKEMSVEDHNEIIEEFFRVLELDDYMFATGRLKKPNPHMILKLAKWHDIILPASYTIGDRWKDIVAGAYAGTNTIYIGDEAKYSCPEGIDVVPDFYARDVHQAVKLAIRGTPVDE